MALIAKENLEDLFRVELRRYVPAGHGFFKLTHEFIRVLLRDSAIRAIIDSLPLIEEWSEEALQAMEIRGDNAVNTQIFAMQMVIDLWKEFPDKFTDQLIEDKVLDRLKDNLRRKDKCPQILSISMFSSLIELLEHIVDTKSDMTSRNAAIKIHNLIAHILADLNPSNSTLKEFYLDQTLRLLQKEYLNLNEMAPVLLRVLQNHSNQINCADVRVLQFLMSKTEGLMERNLLCLMDFNCHIVMSDINTVFYSKQNILLLAPTCSHSALIMPHLIKFVRLLFNWLYKNRMSAKQSKDKTAPADVNKMRETHLLQLSLGMLRNQGVSPKLKIIIRNIAAFVNFQIRKYVIERRQKERTSFVSPEFKQIICSVDLTEASDLSHTGRSKPGKKESPEEILKRYDHVFDVHLNDPEGRDLMPQLDKLLITADLSRKDGMSMSELGGGTETNRGTSVTGNDPSSVAPVLSEHERHLLKLEEFKKIDAKLKKIQKGSFADRKALEDIKKKRLQRDEKHHKEIQEQAILSIKEQQEQARLDKQMVDAKVLSGFAKTELVIELSLDQLIRPLDSQLQEVQTLQKKLMYFDETAQSEERIPLECWFNKHGVLIKAVYNHFAGMLGKILDHSNKLITTAELFKFCQYFGFDTKITLQDVKEIVAHMNLPLLTTPLDPESPRPVGVLGSIDYQQFEVFLCEMSHRYHLPDDSQPTAVMLEACKEIVVREISSGRVLPELHPFLKTGIAGYKRPLPKPETSPDTDHSHSHHITVRTYEYTQTGSDLSILTSVCAVPVELSPDSQEDPSVTRTHRLEGWSVAAGLVEEAVMSAVQTRLFLGVGREGKTRLGVGRERKDRGGQEGRMGVSSAEDVGEENGVKAYVEMVAGGEDGEEYNEEDEPVVREVCEIWDGLVRRAEKALTAEGTDQLKDKLVGVSHGSHLEILESLKRDEARKKRDLLIKEQIRKYKEDRALELQDRLQKDSTNKSQEKTQKPKKLEKRNKIQEEIQKYRQEKNQAYLERMSQENKTKEAEKKKIAELNTQLYYPC